MRLRLPYKGAAIDVFTLGIVLFALISGHIPFREATKNDSSFNLIIEKKNATFWMIHQKNKPIGFYSENLKSLIDGMLTFNPNHRLTISNIINHPWLKESCATMEERATEFIKRKKAKEENECKIMPILPIKGVQSPFLLNVPYKSLTIKVEGHSKLLFTHETNIYLPCSIISSKKPDEIMGLITSSLDKTSLKLKLIESKEKYKASVLIIGKAGEFSVEWRIELIMEGVYNVVFWKRDGDKLEFLEFYRSYIIGASGTKSIGQMLSNKSIF